MTSTEELYTKGGRYKVMMTREGNSVTRVTIVDGAAKTGISMSGPDLYEITEQLVSWCAREFNKKFEPEPGPAPEIA